MPNCSVNGCDFKNSKKGEYQSFPLPENEPLRSKWLKKLNRPYFVKIAQSVNFCIRHFTNNDFMEQQKDSRKRPLKRKKLKEGAVPSLFMEFDPFQPKNERNQPKNENNQPKNEKEPPQELEEGEVTLEMLNEYNMKIENESIIETELVTNSSQGYLC